MVVDARDSGLADDAGGMVLIARLWGCGDGLGPGDTAPWFRCPGVAGV